MQWTGGTVSPRPAGRPGASQRGTGRRAGALGAAAALALTVAACSSPSSSGAGNSAAAAAAVRRAPAATEAAGSAAVAVSVASDEHAGGSSSIGVGVLGAFDFTSDEGEGHITFSGLPKGTPTQSPSIIYTLGGLYLQGTGIFATMTSGKPWVEVDASTLGSIFGSASSTHGGALDALANTLIASPTSVLNTFDTKALTAAALGHPSVGGERTTEYAVTIDPKKAADEATGPLQALYRSLGSSPLTLHVYLDSKGRIVEATDSTVAPKSTGSSGGSITGITVRLSDFGQPVTVTVPPAAEVSSPSSSGA